ARMLRANLVDERGAVLGPHVHVEQHDLHAVVGELLARFAERCGLPHGPALELEVQTAQETDRRVVVDHQHPSRGVVPHPGRKSTGTGPYPRLRAPRLPIENEIQQTGTKGRARWRRRAAATHAADAEPAVPP